MSTPSESPNSQKVLYSVRVGVSADGPAIEAWLNARTPLPVPEARARRLSLDALLEQGGHGICVLGGGTSAVRDLLDRPGQQSTLACLLPVTLVHSLSLGGRVAMAAEWWPPADDAPGWLDAACQLLADWCRAHGIRHIRLAPGLVADALRAPQGFQRDADGLWLRSLIPTPKRLG
ncbi:hypothetical protein [Cupriavidus pauculus]|nr:hypothetical protein [Cupriavidus pauculus]